MKAFFILIFILFSIKKSSQNVDVFVSCGFNATEREEKDKCFSDNDQNNGKYCCFLQDGNGHKGCYYVNKTSVDNFKIDAWKENFQIIECSSNYLNNYFIIFLLFFSLIF